MTISLLSIPRIISPRHNNTPPLEAVQHCQCQQLQSNVTELQVLPLFVLVLTCLAQVVRWGWRKLTKYKWSQLWVQYYSINVAPFHLRESQITLQTKHGVAQVFGKQRYTNIYGQWMVLHKDVYFLVASSSAETLGAIYGGRHTASIWKKP